MEYTLASMRIATICLVVSAIFCSSSRAQAPVYSVMQAESAIRFSVKASVSLEGIFDKWAATLVFPSTDATTGVLDIKIEAASVNTGSELKDKKLKSEAFFDVKQAPHITFHSNKVVQTGPNTFDVHGTFTIRGVSKPETLKLAVTRTGNVTGDIKGIMAFDRKEFGMDSGIPFIRVADRVEVTVDLRTKRLSGPPLVFKE